MSTTAETAYRDASAAVAALFDFAPEHTVGACVMALDVACRLYLGDQQSFERLARAYVKLSDANAAAPSFVDKITTLPRLADFLRHLTTHLE